MNLLYAEVIEIFAEGASRMAKARVGGARKTVCLDLVADVRLGDKIFICDGIALSKLNEEMEAENVSGNTR